MSLMQCDAGLSLAQRLKSEKNSSRPIASGIYWRDTGQK